MLESIQPIVLVGGRSRRFGRDKLREPLDADGRQWLVDRPIAALRGVFGPRVALVGHCHDAVAARADIIIPDSYPGAGPAGGILSALEHTRGDVFVLAGDLPSVQPASIRAVLQHAHASPALWAILGQADDIEPCIGLYRRGIIDLLKQRLQIGRRSLFDLVPPDRLGLCRILAAEAANINTAGALEHLVHQGRAGGLNLKGGVSPIDQPRAHI